MSRSGDSCSTSETILIVDDEEPIRASVRGILGDEGFRVVEADNGRSALEAIRTECPVLVILDIWMPELDGIELLQEIQGKHPEMRVIVISGHGNIDTAVRATQLGAFDFIEKPFSLEGLLQRVQRALGDRSGEAPDTAPAHAPRASGAGAVEALPGRQARTLSRSVVVAGSGLHSGMRTGVILHPAPPNTGIVFESLSSDVEIPALVDYVESTGYATALHRDGATAKTVEHLLATLHAFGITNLRIKMQGEIPILDGSALEFCRLVRSGGVEEQPDRLEEVTVDRIWSIGDPNGGKYLALEPADSFEVDYTLDYPPPVGREHVTYYHEGAESFEAEIAPARTFGFLKDIAELQRMGLAGGGSLHNCILIGDDGIINTALRLESEFARHKILDIMGDLFLLGRPIRGRVVARMTGHTENIALMRQLREAGVA